jgi:hypothetical protein
MSETRFPSYVNMVSYVYSAEQIHSIHEKHLEFYYADSSDCELIQVKTPSYFEKAKCEYTLKINTYRGWKVYNLHTGCFASIPEYEPAFQAENIQREYEKFGLHDVAFKLLPTD